MTFPTLILPSALFVLLLAAPTAFAGPAIGAPPLQSVLLGNCNEEGSLASVNVWIANVCDDGPCSGSGTLTVDVWVANQGCGRRSCDLVGPRYVDGTWSIPCPYEVVNYEVDARDGRVGVWVLNT